MDDVAGAEAVGGDDHFRMESGPEQINGDDGRTDPLVIRVESLAEHHLVSFEGRMTVAADCMTDDLGEEHCWVKAERLKTEMLK